MKIVILGAGGMGSLYGGLLADSGMDVTLVDVNEAHIDAVNARGLRIDSDTGTRQIAVKASRAECADGPVDLLVLFTKTYQSESALKSARHLIGSKTWLMSIQNGLGAIDRLKRFADIGRIIIGMSSFPVDFVGSGHIESHQGGYSETTIMTADGNDRTEVVQIAQFFSRAGLNCKIDPKVRQAIWKKVAFNCALNSLCAICKVTPGIIGQDQLSRSLALRVAAEAVAIAAAAGFEISGNEVSQMVEQAIDKHADHKPSMRQDLEAGRQTEVDALNGAVAAAGREFGVPAPLNETLWNLVKLAERSS